MKKKVLVALLVVLMVGILAFSVIACKKPSGTEKPPVDDDVVDGDTVTCPACGENDMEKTDTMCGDCAEIRNTNLGSMLTNVFNAIDNTIKPIANVEDAASVSASIFVNVEIDKVPYEVKLDIAGSIDNAAKALNWAQIDADILGVQVSLFACNDGEGEKGNEVIYIGQNIFTEEKTWSKLDQVSDDELLSKTACDAILGLLTSLSEENKTLINSGVVNSYASGFVGMISSVLGDLFTSTDADNLTDYVTDDGYATVLQLSKLSAIAGLLGSFDLGEFEGLVETLGGILLGGTVDLDAEEIFVPGENPPTIALAVDVDDDGLFTGLELSYAGVFEIEEGKETEISVSFGLDNVSVSTEGKAYKAPFTGTPGDLVIALDLGAVVPSGITNKAIDARVEIYPEVSVDFTNVANINELYNIAIDVTNVKAIAIASVGDVEKVVAEYNGDAEEDIYIDLDILNEVAGEGFFSEGKANRYYKVPLNLTEKLNNWLDSMKPVVEEKPVVSSAADTFNTVDYVWAIVDDIIKNGFNLGSIMGALEDVDAIIANVEGIFDAFDIDTETKGKATLTLNVDKLMAEVLGDGIVGASEKLNSFKFDLYMSATATAKTQGITISDILAEEDVFNYVVFAINNAMFDGYVAGINGAYDAYVEATYQAYVAGLAQDADVLSKEAWLAQATSPVVAKDAWFTENSIATTWAAWYAENAITADQILAVATALGIEVDTTSIYDTLTLIAGGYAQDGLGIFLGIGLGGEQLKVSIGLDIDKEITKEIGSLNGIKDNATTIDTGATYTEGEGEDAVSYKGIDLLLGNLFSAVTNWLETNINDQTQA